MSSLQTQMRYLNPYDVHKLIVNEYLLKKPGDTCHLKRDDSKDKNDLHIILENHKFLWEEDDPTATWEQQFAKRYYNKLFKEYCIGDLSRYKENKIALRWRIEREVINGKGQFICGNKKCTEENGLRTWEVNFGYTEQGQKKNALVKISWGQFENQSSFESHMLARDLYDPVALNDVLTSEREWDDPDEDEDDDNIDDEFN